MRPKLSPEEMREDIDMGCGEEEGVGGVWRKGLAFARIGAGWVIYLVGGRWVLEMDGQRAAVKNIYWGEGSDEIWGVCVEVV